MTSWIDVEKMVRNSGDRNVLLPIIGGPGSGKSVTALKYAENQVDNCSEIHVYGFTLPKRGTTLEKIDLAGQLAQNLRDKYPHKFFIHEVLPISDGSRLSLNDVPESSLVIIDEPEYAGFNGDFADFFNNINVKNLTICVCSQAMDCVVDYESAEIKKSVGGCLLGSVQHRENDFFGVEAMEKAKNLQIRSGEFGEMLLYIPGMDDCRVIRIEY